MNRHTFTRTLAGLSVIAFGVLALLGALNIISFGSLIAMWWPLILVWIGVLSFINTPRDFGWPLILVVIGLLFEIRALNLVTFNVWQLIWPLIIIFIGASIVFNRGRTHFTKESRDSHSASAILSGQNIKNQSSDYKGGSVSAILGGVKVDLSEAKLSKEATLEVFAMMGGIEIIVPREWAVESRVTPVAGGVENRAYIEKAAKGTPKLIVVGEAIMGGIEIKH
jgi:predicted membrane protein